MKDLEQEVSNTMRFLCGFNSAQTSISKAAINHWLENYSTTVFVNGRLRQVVFTPVTLEMYNVKTEEIL